MCGIAAVIEAGSQVERSTLIAMGDRVAHRGPDGSGTWVAPAGAMAVGLAHRRLAIVDLSEQGRQPMISPDGRVVLVYNGMLYNFVELRNELEAQGAAFRTSCDTEVLLTAYLTWGAGMLPRLNGMFAFAIYDGRTETVLVARDRFGEKPLYVTELPGGGLAVASEVKALLAHPHVRSVVDEQALSAWFTSGFLPPGHRVLFEGVDEFPAATAMTFDLRSKSRQLRRYWTPDYDSVHDDLSLREASDELAARLDRSVRLRMRSDVPVGALLSGGQDSSAIVAALWEHIEDPAALTVYSARFDDDPAIDEGPAIDTMLGRSPFPSRAVHPSAEGLADAFDRLLWHHEQPVGGASMFLEWAVLHDARSSGSIVMLDGQGADELLGGYEYYFPRRQLDLLEQGEEHLLDRETRRYRQRLAAAATDVPGAERRFSDASLDPDRLLHLRRSLDRATAQTALDNMPTGAGYFRRQLAQGLLHDMLPLQLHSADRNAMAFGIETRFPFLDYDLVDWAIALPDEYLVAHGWMKYLLRTATWRRLPEAIRWRRDKVGFMAPQDAWLAGPLADWAHELLSSGPVTERPEYRNQKIARRWREHRQGKSNHSDLLWRFLAANRWLQMFDHGAWSGPSAGAAEQRLRAA